MKGERSRRGDPHFCLFISKFRTRKLVLFVCCLFVSRLRTKKLGGIRKKEREETEREKKGDESRKNQRKQKRRDETRT